MTPALAANAVTEMVDHLLAHSEGIASGEDDLDHLVAALDIVQALCWENVSLKDIPRPTGMDAVQMALAAGVVERLVKVYSTPPHNLPQQAPAWCAKVPPSPVDVWLVNREWADGATLNPIFRRRKIMAMENFLMFA